MRLGNVDLGGLTAKAPVQRLRAAKAALKPYKPYVVPAEETYGEDGPWDFLNRLAEMPHYAVIAGYLRHVAPAGNVLDVGCGEGLLVRHLGPAFGYTGIDISAEAVRRAQESVAGVPGRIISAAADATTYEPDGSVDAVVFNESLYYLDDPAAVMAHYDRFLKPDGALIVSMYDAPTTTRVWRAIDATRTASDAVSVRHQGGTAWDIRLYRSTAA